MFTHSSNKHQTGTETDLAIDKAETGVKPITVSKPFMDKVTIVITPANDDDAMQIHQAIYTAFGDKETFQTAGYRENQGYHGARYIALADTSSRPLIQYRKKDNKAERIRLEFNPRKIGLDGLSELAADLVSIVPDGWEYVIKNGHVTRLDVAVDVYNVRMSEFLCLSAQGISSMMYAVDGHLRYIKLGKKGDQTLVYSRKNKRLDKGQPWTGSSCIRIERRLKNPAFYHLSKLTELQNPFSGLTMVVNLPGTPPGMKINEWLMFGDSVQIRGLQPALALIPKERRAKYRAHLKAHGKSWWKPDNIWESWSDAVEKSQLGSHNP